MRLATLLLLLAAAAAEEDAAARWRFEFPNGDRLHGDVRRIRSGTLVLTLENDPHRALRVPLRKVSRATRLDPDGEAPLPTEEILRLRDDTVLLGRFRGIVEGRVEFDVASIGTVPVSGDEVAEYLPTEEVVRAYYRSLSAPRSADPGHPIPQARFAALWRDLGQSDREDAWHARRALVRAGPHAVARMAERLRTLPDAPQRLRRLVGWLEHEDPEVRRLAHVHLQHLRRLAEPVLRESLPVLEAPEARARVASLLVPWPADEGEDHTPEEVRRVLRALAILEEMGTPEARDVLAEVASGDTRARTVRAAREALQRLGAPDEPR